MHTENASRLNLPPTEPGMSGLGGEQAEQDISAGQQRAATGDESKSPNALARHKGKLAVGAAAMLGVAIFYKWREHQLAKEDPEEYARLQRLKHVLDNEDGRPKVAARKK